MLKKFVKDNIKYVCKYAVFIMVLDLQNLKPIGIYNLCAPDFCQPLAVRSIIMYMTMYKIFWLIISNKFIEASKAAVAQILSIMYPQRRSVGHKNIDIFLFKDPVKIQSWLHPVYLHAHLKITVLIFSRAITHGALKASYKEPLVFNDPVVDIDAAFRTSGLLSMFGMNRISMMVSKNIKKRFIEHSDYKLEIAIWKIAA